jgi:hypothetical protein
MAYDLSLEIWRCDQRSCGSEGFHVYPLGTPFPAGERWHAHIPLTPTEVYNAVEAALRVWHDKVIHLDVDVGGTSVKPFQRQWDFGDRTDLLQAIGPEVAQAGEALFYQLFEKGGEDLTKLAQRLREVMTTKPVKMRILSDEFFAPWGLFYFPPGTSVSPQSVEFWDGFWGARHVIDHETRTVGSSVVIDGARRMPTAVAVDENLPVSSAGNGILGHLNFFEARSVLDVEVWRNKVELKAGLSADPLSQVILYFCCHGQAAGGPPCIQLTDQEPIEAHEIDFWLRHHKEFATHPVVFFNACEGGVMQTRLYETIAPQFLQRQAAGLIGAHTQLPTLFATHYAQAFFEQLLDHAGDKVRVGPLMTRLARQFITDHHNPLGLVYALYRASDVYVRWDEKEGG